MRIETEKNRWEKLKEVAALGSRKATLSLSKLLKKSVRVKVVSVRMMDISAILPLLGKKDSLSAVTYFDVQGDFEAHALLVFPLKMALKLSDFLLGRKPGTTKILDPFAQSAIKELGNISSASYLVALSDAFEMRLIHSVPNLAVDMLQAVLDGVLISLAIRTKKVIVLDTIFDVGHVPIHGHFLFLPSLDGIRRLLKSSQGRIR